MIDDRPILENLDGLPAGSRVVDRDGEYWFVGVDIYGRPGLVFGKVRARPGGTHAWGSLSPSQWAPFRRADLT